MSNQTLTEKLQTWVAEGGRLVGELLILSEADGGFRLLHHLDSEEADLKKYASPVQAREIIRYDEAGEYRPMKSAPGLRRGWELRLENAEDLREALDYFYPAVVGTWFGNQVAEIDAVPLREVLGRQTGMYRFANNVSDDGAQAMVAKACGSSAGCLKRVCWGLSDELPITSLPNGETDRLVHENGEMPMLCVEACNWLVAIARKASAAEFEAAQEKSS